MLEPFYDYKLETFYDSKLKTFYVSKIRAGANAKTGLRK